MAFPSTKPLPYLLLHHHTGLNCHVRPPGVTFENNLVFNQVTHLAREAFAGYLDEFGDSVQATNNWVTTVDPGFVDYQAGDFRLRPDAEVFEQISGFVNIPFEGIGPRKDVE